MAAVCTEQLVSNDSGIRPLNVQITAGSKEDICEQKARELCGRARRHGCDHHTSQWQDPLLTTDWLTRCIYEEDEEKLKALYSELTGKVAEVAKKVGMRNQLILFDQGVQHMRIKNAIQGAEVKDQCDKSGNKITTMAALITALEEDDRIPPPPKTGEEYEPTRLSEYWEMVNAVGTDNGLGKEIKAAQAKDKFSATKKIPGRRFDAK